MVDRSSTDTATPPAGTWSYKVHPGCCIIFQFGYDGVPHEVCRTESAASADFIVEACNGYGGVAQGQTGPQTLGGMIRAIYDGMNAEDCSFIDFAWARQRGYILPNDGTSTLSSTHSPVNGLKSLSGLRILTPEQSDFLYDAAVEIDRLRGALELLTDELPEEMHTLDEPDEDWEVIVKMRAIAREALAGAVGTPGTPK